MDLTVAEAAPVAASPDADLLEIDRLIDQARLGPLHLRVFVLCLCVGVFDGMDTQSIGAASSLIERDLSIPAAKFGVIFSAMLIGAALGAAVFGRLADRFGRKPLLILAVIVIALATVATTGAHDFGGLVAIRFVAGLGLGGATPCFLALGTEYAPAAYRTAATTALWAGFAVGAALGGVVNAIILAHGVWRPLFLVGGAAPLVLLPFLILFLPESVRFLVSRGAPPSRVLPLARRLDPEIAADARIEVRGGERPDAGVTPLAPRAAALVPLYVAAAFVFGVLSLVVLWSPILLASRGVSAATAAALLGMNALGGLLGNISAAPLVRWIGARRSSASLLIGAGCIVAIAFGGRSFMSLAPLMVGAGAALGIGACVVLSTASQLYSVSRRSAGLGLTMAASRFGQFVGPLVVSGLLIAGLSSRAVFTAFAALSAVAAVCLHAAGVRRNARQLR